ncbi:MAG: RIP metalloprotease RseP [Candidatus Aminicenantes bacterium]|nr:RIP metalloprotease RseP [Candidatus Aminicenantes bacterium]
MVKIFAFLETIFSFIIVFGILVFVHEFGHFFVAKLVKVRVLVFSWGYGKRLFGFKKGETDYRVSLVPMGGYVKFSGEEAFEEGKKLEPGDFMAKKKWERVLVLAMGSIMNIILAVVLLSVINMVGVTFLEHREQSPFIGWIEPGSPAERANLQMGDEILSINKRKMTTWSNVEIAVLTRPDRMIDVEVKRGEEILSVQLMTESKTEYARGYAGFDGRITIQVLEITPQNPAEKAGLEVGDIILAVNKEPVYHYQFTGVIENNAEKELEFLIEREGETFTLLITPRLQEGVGIIGVITVPKTVFKQYSFFPAIGVSIKQNADLAFLLINYLRDLITGEASAKQVGGPIEIASMSRKAFRQGFFAMMWFIAFVSLQLGIINLFPIPVLDGGHILVLTLEGLFRRDFSLKLKQIVMQIGFTIFIFLIVFLLLNDIVRRLPNGWESLLFWK